MRCAGYLHLHDIRQFEALYSFIHLDFSLAESSVHEGSTGNDNDGSVCGSDSFFFKQSEGENGQQFKAAPTVISATIIIDIIFCTWWCFLAILIFLPFVYFFHLLKGLSFYSYCLLMAALTKRDRSVKGMFVGQRWCYTLPRWIVSSFNKHWSADKLTSTYTQI